MQPKFTIKGEDYFFGDLTIRTYYELKAILTREELDKETEFDIVSALTKCPKDILRKVKFADWALLWEEANLTIQSLGRSTENIRPIILFNGDKYGLPAPDEMTIGEFADLDVLTSSPDYEKRLHEVAAVLYRKVLKQTGNQLTLEPYDTEEVKERKELFLDMPFTAIKSANAFFLQYVNSSLKNTAEYLLKSPEMKLISPEDQENLRSLLQPELGGEYSIPSLEKTLSDFHKLRTSKYVAPSTGLRGKKTKFASKIWPFNRKLNTP